MHVAMSRHAGIRIQESVDNCGRNPGRFHGVVGRSAHFFHDVFSAAAHNIQTTDTKSDKTGSEIQQG